ncbi:MAG: cbb3-type cytochrome c oxidase subunit II [Opitutae bacterium]|nr:cbb3-type cytochrome c oxidase subunit II [Opitutae bacterium]
MRRATAMDSPVLQPALKILPRRLARRAIPTGRVLAPIGFHAVAAVLALATCASVARAAALATDPLVAHGHEVYIHEGCIHCHSQYVRPRVPADVERWGPASDWAKLAADQPPLPGNRRNGPDLANVANRRSAEWNRLHLQKPRAVSPGSRMPSYAHLFRRGGDESDGEALVAYLASLGADTIPQRLAQTSAWRPDRSAPPTDAAHARRIFAQLCTPCHGPAGHGDGPLAARLSVRPPDWPAQGWRRVPPDADVELALARIVKFGLPGSPMAGHETLPDTDVLGLARLVRSWQKH